MKCPKCGKSAIKGTASAAAFVNADNWVNECLDCHTKFTSWQQAIIDELKATPWRKVWVEGSPLCDIVTERDTLREQVERLKGELNNRIPIPEFISTAKIQRENDQLKAELETEQENHSVTGKQYSDCYDEVIRLLADIEAARKEVEFLNLVAKNQDIEIAIYRNKLEGENMGDTYEELKKQKDGIIARETEKQVKPFRDEIENLQSQLTLANERLAEAEKENKLRLAVIYEAVTTLSSFDELIETFGDDHLVTELIKELRLARSEISRLQSALDEAKGEVGQLKLDQHDAFIVQDGLESDIKKLEAQLKAASQDMANNETLNHYKRKVFKLEGLLKDIQDAVSGPIHTCGHHPQFQCTACKVAAIAKKRHPK